MGTFGALMGSLIAGLAYTLSGRNYAVTFSLSALPALGALLLVTTVGHTPNVVQLHALLQPIACAIATDCLLSCSRLYAQSHCIVCSATGCTLICCRSNAQGVDTRINLIKCSKAQSQLHQNLMLSCHSLYG